VTDTKRKICPPIRETGVIVWVIFFWMSVYTFSRLLFFLFNQEWLSLKATDSLVNYFVAGLRFDLAVVMLATMPVILILALGAVSSHRFQGLRSGVLWITLAIHSFGLGLNLADILYFRHTFRRQTDELLAIAPEAIKAALAEIGINLTVSFFLLALVPLFGYLFILSWKKISWFRPYPRFTGSLRWPGRVVLASLVLILGIVGARGGLQNRPLRPGSAFQSDNLALGQLSLNSLYTFLWSALRPEISERIYMPAALAQEICRDLVRTDSETFLDDEFPFMRIPDLTESYTSDKSPKNVVILIFESWNALSTGAINPESRLTPNFDSIALDSRLFTQCYASGDRSIQALPAILSSIPNMSEDRLIGGRLEMTRIRGLGSVLKEQGYETVFAMGAEPTSMGFDSYSRACGFDHYISLDDFSGRGREWGRGPESVDGIWGAYDEPFLLYLKDYLDTLRQPFALVFFSLSGHTPFAVPPSFEKQHPLKGEFDPSLQQDRGLSARLQSRGQLYADFSLGSFMRKSSLSQWFSNTLFVVTADHVGWCGNIWEYTEAQRFQIPLLFYAPGLIEPGRDSLPAQQADITPSILDILNIRSRHSSMGSSLFSPRGRRFAFFAKGPTYGFILDSFYLSSTRDSSIALYNLLSDRGLSDNLAGRKKFDSLRFALETVFRAYLQTGLNALIGDRVYPHDTGKKESPTIKN